MSEHTAPPRRTAVPPDLQRAGRSQASTLNLLLEAVGRRGMEVTEKNTHLMQIRNIIHLLITYNHYKVWGNPSISITGSKRGPLGSEIHDKKMTAIP